MTDYESRGSKRIYKSYEVWGVMAGGVVASLALFALVVAVGQVGSPEALELIESVVPAARFLATAVITASMTVLALLLTLLGLSLTSSYTFNPRLYTRVSHITILSVIAIVGSTATLLAASLPIRQVSDNASFYDLYYYFIAGSISLLAGLAISIGLMIGATLRGLVRIGHPEGVSDLLEDSQTD